MTKYKVAVSLMNKRSMPVEDLSDKSNVVGKISEGFEFESVEEIVNSLGTWYRDRDGHYYWSGGLASALNPKPDQSEVMPEQTIAFDPNKMSWGHKLYDLPFIWRDLNTMGSGITVAVIDTGADHLHPDLADNIVQPLSKSFTGSSGGINDTDGHGTNMAGIIAASGKNLVYGVAPGAKLVIVKATETKNTTDTKPFVEALNYVAGIPEIDIVSVSNGFNPDSDLKKSIENCIAAKKIVVAAIGNNRDIIGKPDGPDRELFPACYDGVIAIGAFDQQGRICSFSNWNEQLQLLAPGDYEVLTTGVNQTIMKGAGTSIAAAFVSGSLALLLSYAKEKHLPVSQCIQVMLDSCDDIGNKIGRDIQSGYGRLNLRNAIAKIKT